MDISISRDQLAEWAKRLETIPEKVLVYYGPGGCTEVEWEINEEVSSAWDVAEQIKELLERKEDDNDTSV